MAETNGHSTAALQTLAWTTMSQALAGLGLTFEGQRNLYTALGWKPALTAQDFVNKYLRQDIAARILDIYPEYTWRVPPRITDDQDADPVTPFEAAWQALSTRVQIPTVWQTLDRLMGLGHYAVLLLGCEDGQSLSSPLTRARSLLYTSPYGEVVTEIQTWNGNESSPRFLKPELYKIALGRGRTGLVTPSARMSGLTTSVHWSRVIHVAEKSFDGGTIGTPRLEGIYNRLDDLEKLLGGSAEMFWQAGRGNLVAAVRDGATAPDGQEKEELQRQLDEFVHGLRQMLRVQGMDVSRLTAAVASPKEAIEEQRIIIATGVGIPQRILYGSERGELASTQDQATWETIISARRLSMATPVFVRPTIQRLIEVGILPRPRGDAFEVIWPPSGYVDPLRQAEVAERTARAAATYVESGAEVLIPPAEFREQYLGLPAIAEGEQLEEDLDEPPGEA